MKVTILPSTAQGAVLAPPSKSVTHRALIGGALSEKSWIHNVAFSQDVEATLRCLQAMGAQVTREDDAVIIGGLNPFDIPAGTKLDCGESGSTLRFLLPLCLLANQPITLCGSEQLMNRPLWVYENICRDQGLAFERVGNAITVCGPLRAGLYNVPGDVSSQFVTGMLFALSLLDEDSTLSVTGVLESASYVNLTLMLQNAFGVAVDNTENVYVIRGGQTYRGCSYIVEGDYSHAAFLDAFNLLGGNVKVLGLSGASAQSDRVYPCFYKQLHSENHSFDLTDCPDLGPVMFALSAALEGAKFTGTARLRFKESDRVAAMAEELAKFGISCTIAANEVIVHKGSLKRPNVDLSSHNDHRIVMALALLCSLTGGTISGAEAVAKSYPDYFSVLHSLGLEVYFEEDM